MGKIIFILIVLATHETILQGQNNVFGTYRDNFGSKLILNSDSTYKYTHSFDLSSSWSIGKWSLRKDTIIFSNTVIYDTITTHCYSINGEMRTSRTNPKLTLSIDEKSDAISDLDDALTQISGGGQNRYPQPMKLFFENNKLYEINKNGKPNRKRIKGLMTQKKFESSYIKE
jgi:hypothetical protein